MRNYVEIIGGEHAGKFGQLLDEKDGMSAVRLVNSPSIYHIARAHLRPHSALPASEAA